MTLQQYFRLITMSIFQKDIANTANSIMGQKFNYDNVFFKCPRVYCKDGWNCSFQINNINYCESNNGYRQLGYTWITCEFGYPSEYDETLAKYAEEERIEDNFISVGSIPIKIAQEIIDKHGGIDIDKITDENQYKLYVEGIVCLTK